MLDGMIDDSAHDALFSEATIRIGEIHGLVLQSTHVMDEARWIQKKSQFGSTYEWTEFGNEVGQDEIHWWIFEKETNHDELLAMTQKALPAAQKLMNDSAKLRDNDPDSYEALLVSLKDFGDNHLPEIKALHEYVLLLEKRDPMAPRILFTYRVWGSTRMADRELSWKRDGAEKLTEKNLRTLSEIALGLFSRGDFTYNDKFHEIGFEIYEGLDPETTPDDYQIIPPVKKVVRRTARATYENVSTYFHEIRDSLRNIELDVQKFKQQRELYESDDFWRSFVEKARRSKIAEPELWDFKETLNIWHVRADPARRAAKIEFAEDVASFANVRGGVLIVGVNDRREIVGIGTGRDLENRLKAAKDVLAEFVKYRRDIVSFRQVPMGAQRNVICLVVVISQAISPVGVSDGQGRFSYPVRRETGIERVDEDKTPSSKLHLKSENREFLTDLRQFVKDN
jgi:hypothetical protein